MKIYPLYNKIYLALKRRLRLMPFCYFNDYKRLKCLDANFILQSIYPDGGTSCISKNNITAIYDLHIIIPAYNVQSYIGKCLDSVVNQRTRFTYMVSVINDGSCDLTGDILAKYESFENVEVINQKNKGLSGARNTSLKNIKGRYVMFVDSDDEISDGAIDALMAKAIKADADIVEGNYFTLYGDHAIKSSYYSDEDSLQQLNGFAWGKVLKSSLFSNIVFPEKYWYEDTLMTFVVYSMAKKMCRISDYVYCYRYNEAGITKSSYFRTKTIDTIYITRQLLSDRLALELNNDVYEIYLRQVHTNFNRTLLLLPKIIVPAVFIESCNLREEFFPIYRTQNPQLKGIETSLIKRDFNLYLKKMRDYDRLSK